MEETEEWPVGLRKRETARPEGTIHLDFVLGPGDDTISHIGIRERSIVVSGSKVKVGSIGGVATKEEYRNRGGVAESLSSPTRTVMAVAGEVDVPALASLYDEELVRWERSLGEFSRLLGGNAVPLWRPVEPFLILRGGRYTAYVMIQKPEESRREEEECVYASEYARRERRGGDVY